MKVLKMLGLVILGMSLMVGCSQTTQDDTNVTQQKEEQTDGVEDVTQEEKVEEVKVLTQEEIKTKLSELKASGDVEGYVLTALLATQVTNDKNPFNIKDYNGNLINCSVTSKVDGNNMEVVLNVPNNRDTIDIEQLETLVNTNLVNLGKEKYDITLLVNDTVIGNFTNK